MQPRPESLSSLGEVPDLSLVGDRHARTPIEAARAGAPGALDGLIERCRDYLLLIANAEVPSEIRPKMGASDLVQQSMAEAWQAFDRFQGHNEFEFRGWLRRILINNLHDAARQFRETARRDTAREIPLALGLSGEGRSDNLIAPDPSPSACAVRSEELTLLHAAIDRLPIHYAQIIRLRNLEYLTFAEVGERMEMPKDLARKLWERAVKRLAKELRRSRDAHQ